MRVATVIPLVADVLHALKTVRSVMLAALTEQRHRVESMGAPFGNQNATKAKRWSDAIDRALEKRSKGDGIKALDDLAEKFLDEVEAAGIAGYRELADRLDGKPPQAIVGADGGPVVVEIVRFADSNPP